MDNKPICYVPGREKVEVFSGVPSFLGLPKISSEEELNNFDLVFMGVPWEGICTYGGYSSCELSTKNIREASVRYGGYLPEFDVDVFDYFTGGDFGDCAIENGNYEFSFNSMRNKLSQVLKAGKFPVTFGGDHSISYPLISEFAKAKGKGKVGVIHFDAHMDNMDEFGKEKYARCSPFHRLYEDENIDPTKIVHFGIRGPRNNPLALKEAKKYGATVITGMEAKEEGWRKSIKKALDIVTKDTDTFYITVCSDILDVANNPAGPPDPCGMTTYELAMMLHECGKAGAGAFDFVELYPGKDPSNTSGHVAVWMSIYLLTGLTKFKFELK
ncbi:agmatinase family protein [Fusobacterium sp. MFO224]|uniref:agmatinase family protein n=1 Tax=Fusobacterium sp. MFO224 TaxID=3378070 RepID=UPI0038518A39